MSASVYVHKFGYQKWERLRKKALIRKFLVKGLKDILTRNFYFQREFKSSSITRGYSSVMLHWASIIWYVFLVFICTGTIKQQYQACRLMQELGVFVWFFFSLFLADIWSDHSFQTDPDLPPGWKKINDIAGIYYWHIPTGTTQWQRPVSIPTDLQGSREGSLGSITPSPTPETEVTCCVFLWATYCEENWNNFLNLQV